MKKEKRFNAENTRDFSLSGDEQHASLAWQIFTAVLELETSGLCFNSLSLCRSRDCCYLLSQHHCGGAAPAWKLCSTSMSFMEMSYLPQCLSWEFGGKAQRGACQAAHPLPLLPCEVHWEYPQMLQVSGQRHFAKGICYPDVLPLRSPSQLPYFPWSLCSGVIWEEPPLLLGASLELSPPWALH